MHGGRGYGDSGIDWYYGSMDGSTSNGLSPDESHNLKQTATDMTDPGSPAHADPTDAEIRLQQTKLVQADVILEPDYSFEHAGHTQVADPADPATSSQRATLAQQLDRFESNYGSAEGASPAQVALAGAEVRLQQMKLILADVLLKADYSSELAAPNENLLQYYNNAHEQRLSRTYQEGKGREAQRVLGGQPAAEDSAVVVDGPEEGVVQLQQGLVWQELLQEDMLNHFEEDGDISGAVDSAEDPSEQGLQRQVDQWLQEGMVRPAVQKGGLTGVADSSEDYSDRSLQRMRGQWMEEGQWIGEGAGAGIPVQGVRGGGC